MALSASVHAAVLFSYDATTGQFPTEQGWSAFEVDTTGPLTEPNAEGSSSTHANVAIETFAGDGLSVLHIRDTLTDSTADLPNYFYPWDDGQKQVLANAGLKFTMLFAAEGTSTGGKGNVRIDLSGSIFESFDNIGSNRAIQVQGLSAELRIPDGALHELVITGTRSGANSYIFSATFDGDPLAAPLFGEINSPNANLADSIYFGASSSGGRGTDIFVRSVTVETLSTVEQVATIVRTPNSPYGSLSITNNGNALPIVGYSILSGAEALAPSQWQKVNDPNGQWITLSEASDRDNLSEFDAQGDGITLGMGQTRNFGNVWIQNPTEDVVVELLLNDGTIIPVAATFSGNGGNPYVFGDLDFDGDFDVADFTAKFAPKYGTNTTTFGAAERYQVGDFNDDGIVDILDFLIYNDAYQSANPLAAPLDANLLAVPEPQAWHLCAIGLAACGIFYRQNRRMEQMLPKPIATGIVLLTLAAGSSTNAAELIAHWKLDEAFGSTTAIDSTNGGHNAVKNGAVAAGSPGIIGNAWYFPGGVGDFLAINTTPTGDSLLNMGQNFSITGWTRVSSARLATMFSISDDTQPSSEVLLRATGDQGLSNYGSADVNARPGISPGEAVSTTRVNDDQWHFISFTQNASGWSLYVDGAEEDSGVAADGLANSPAIAANVAHIGINKDNTEANNGYQWALEGLIDDLAVWNDRLSPEKVRSLHLGGLNGFDASTPFEATLALEVNTDNGNVTLKNNSGFPFEIDAYRILSPQGSLTPATWSSLDAQGYDGNVWTKMGNSNTEVAEGAFGESTVLAGSNTTINLGALYDENKDIRDLVFEYHVVGTGNTVLQAGSVSYSSIGTDNADFNNDGDVDGRDFLIWQRGFGSGTTSTQGDANGSGTVDAADLAIWQNQYGSSSLAAAAQVVPEPTSVGLVALALVCLAGHGSLRRQSGRSLAMCLVVMLAALASSNARADVFVDRTYTFGSDATEGAQAGIVLGSGNTFGTTFDTANAPGSGDLQDLSVIGAPTYVTVTGRPGTLANSLGASFDGENDYLRTPVNLVVPHDVWNNIEYFPTTPFPLNFAGIRVQGMQLWVKPDGTRQNVRQDIIRNGNAHAISVTANNNWGAVIGTGVPLDSGVPVAFDQWTHVMHVSGATNLADGSTQSGGALFVNGVIVKAGSTPYTFNSNHPFTIGAQQFQGDIGGATPSEPGNFFKGIVDDVDVFLWGTNTSGHDYGRFHAGTDNDWISAQLLGIPDGDINRDGQVSGNGTGPASSDDVTALIENWRYRQVIDGLQLGDWNSRLKGDLNFDGAVDLQDAYLVRSGLMSSGLGTLDFSLLTSVPEPATTTMVLTMLVAMGLARRRNHGV